MVIEWSFWSIKQIIIIWSAITDLQIFLEKSIFGAFLFKMYSYLGEIVFGLGRQNTRRALNFLRMILFQDFSFCNKSLVRLIIIIHTCSIVFIKVFTTVTRKLMQKIKPTTVVGLLWDSTYGGKVFSYLFCQTKFHKHTFNKTSKCLP